MEINQIRLIFAFFELFTGNIEGYRYTKKL